eukprot:11665566-Ditylum_brightwellii.AAC.1
MGFDWVTTHDVDEYIRMPPTYNQSLPKFLGDYFPNAKEEVGALRMKSASFGKNIHDPTDNSVHHPLLVDYVWRKNSTLGNARSKILVNPQQVNYLDVHDTKGAAKPTVDLEPYQQLHIHHYKNPENGPHAGGDPSQWVKDESLSLYRQAILDSLTEQPNTTQVYSNN